MGINDIMKEIEGEIERARDHLGRLEAMQAAGRRKSVKNAASGGPTVERVRFEAKRHRTRRVPKSVSPPVDQAEVILAHVREHPGSTAGEVVEANPQLSRNSVSTKMTDMAREGKLKKEERGYSAP